MIYKELTGKVLEASFEVSNELSIGFIESVYRKSLVVALRQKGLNAEQEVPLEVKFRNNVVGDFYADILVENKVIVELKTVKNFVNEHFAQLINYLKATEVEVGLIINFGNPKIEYRRFENKFLNKNINIKNLLTE